MNLAATAKAAWTLITGLFKFVSFATQLAQSEEKCRILTAENVELKAKVAELEKNADIQHHKPINYPQSGIV